MTFSHSGARAARLHLSTAVVLAALLPTAPAAGNRDGEELPARTYTPASTIGVQQNGFFSPANDYCDDSPAGVVDTWNVYVVEESRGMILSTVTCDPFAPTALGSEGYSAFYIEAGSQTGSLHRPVTLHTRTMRTPSAPDALSTHDLQMIVLPMVVMLIIALLPAPPALADKAPDACVTPLAADGHEPPCNPHLGQDIWAVSHRGPYAQASSPYPGPAGPAEQVDVFHDFLFDAPIQIQFSSPYADGQRVAWGSTVGFDGSIFKYDPDANAFIDRYSPTAEGGEAPGPGSISGAYNMIDADDHLIVGRETAVEVYGDAVPGDRLSPVAQLARFELPASALCRDEDKLVGLTMTADGRVAFATEFGVVGVLPRQPAQMTPATLQVVSLNGAACGDASVPADALESVSNSIAADENGGIYIVTSTAQYRVDAVDGGAPQVAWRAAYPTNDSAGGTGVGGGGRLGVGSGSTPSLMGTQPDDDRFVAITDGRDLMHVILMWRDDVPTGWQPIADGYDPRIACEFPVTYGEDDAESSLSEQSLLVRGNSVVVVDNYQQFDPILGRFPAQFAPYTQLVSGLPGNQPTGLQRIDWNPMTRRCEEAWANPDISIPNGIPTMSADTGLVYGIGSRDGVWTLEGVDFATGEVALTVPTTAFPSNNSFYAATQVGPDASVWTGNFGGITRFETCDPLATDTCGRRLDPGEASFGPPATDPGGDIAGSPSAPAQPDDRPAPDIQRAAGGDRVATAVALSQRRPAADTVVIATGTDYPDALTGAPLAASLDAPLLLSTGPTLPTLVADEIRRLGASQAIILGGLSAIPAAVADKLVDVGLQVERIAGPSRFDTAGLIADRIGIVDTVVLAEGANADPARGWPDAVTGAGLGASLGLPVLLATTDDLPGPSADRLGGVAEVLLVGGEAAISPTVAQAVADLAGRVVRLSGRDRHATSFEVALEAQRRGADPATTFVAGSGNWPDGLAAAAAAGGVGGVLVLVDGLDLDRSPSTAGLLAQQDRAIRTLVIVGGSAAVTQATEQRLTALTA